MKKWKISKRSKKLIKRNKNGIEIEETQIINPYYVSLLLHVLIFLNQNMNLIQLN